MITKKICVLLCFQSFVCAKHFFNKGYFYSRSFQKYSRTSVENSRTFQDILHFKVKKGLRPIWYGEGRRHLATLSFAWPLCGLKCSLRSLRNLWGRLVTSLRISHNFSVFKDYSRPVRTMSQLYSLKMNILQWCQLCWIIRETPDLNCFSRSPD